MNFVYSKFDWSSLVLMATLLVSLVAILGGCDRAAAEGSFPAAPTDRPYHVVATVGMVGDIVRNVAGDRATVSVLMGEGVDPHLYKGTRDDVARMMNADVVFYSGLLLEGKLTDVFDKLGRRKPVVAVTAAIDDDYLLLPEGAEGHPDPHVWMDPQAWARAVDVITQALCDYDPAHADLYRTNAARYQETLARLGAYGKEALGSIPPTSRVLVTSHDAFGYFGKAFDLDVRGVQGLATDSEAGLRQVNELVDLLVERDVRAVFVETSVPRKSIEALLNGARARGHEVTIGGTLYSDAMGSAGTYEGTYLGMLDHNITVVARALGGDAPAGGMQGKLTRNE